MNTNNGRNLKLARDSRGLSQSKLADLLKITQATLSRIEKGQIPLSDTVITGASECLDYPRSFFKKNVPIAGETTLFFRKRATMTSKCLSVLESRINILANCIDELIESVEIPELMIPSVEPSLDNTPAEIAFKIRNYLKVPQGPIDNIVTLLERNGVVVIFIDLESADKFDGLTMFTNKQVPVIWLNKKMPNDRKRFSLAHELGHLVMHLRSQDLDKPEVDKEREANEFASEFLMPKELCKMDFFNLRYNDLALRKVYWKVSKAAIIYRARELNCISESTKRYLFITLGRNGERKQESVEVSIDSPKIVYKMTKLHLDELEYSMEELADLLGLSPSEIKACLLNEPNFFHLKTDKLSISL